MHSDRILGRSEGTLTRPALFDPSPYHDSPRPSCLRCRTIRLRCRTTLTARLQTRRFVFIARPCDFRFRIVVVDAVAVPRPEQLRMVMARSPKSPKARRNGTFGVEIAEICPTPGRPGDRSPTFCHRCTACVSVFCVTAAGAQIRCWTSVAARNTEVVLHNGGDASRF